MNFSIQVDWKFVVALGASVAAVIFAAKMDGTEAEQVSIHAIDTCKELVEARNSLC